MPEPAPAVLTAASADGPLPGPDPQRRLRELVERLGVLWMLVLPVLRPLTWSGEATSSDNLLYLCLLATAIATGLLHRALRPAPWRWSWTIGLGLGFLAVAAIGCWRSPLPALAWTWWWGVLLHLAAPLALAPLIARRPGVLVAGLLAGLVLEGAVTAGLVLWERPAIQLTLALDPAALEHERLREQYEVRADSWRLEGSFLLANTLASYLILLLPLVAGMAMAAWRARLPGRWALAAATALALVLLARSGSKAGILALLAALVLTGILALPTARLRVACVASGLALLVVALLLPGLRARLAGSAGVRIEYWQAALDLVAERPLAGHGIEGFQVHFPRVKLPQGEETILVHNELLQAAVDLGVPAALLLAAWWLALAAGLRPRRADPRPDSTPVDGPAPWMIAVLAGLLLYAVLAAGLLGASFASWPASGWLDAIDEGLGVWAGVLVPGAMLAVLAVALLSTLRRLPPPDPWACFTGVVACLLHALADFHLHSTQVVGILALVAVLGTRKRAQEPVAPALPAVPAAQVGGARPALLAGAALLVLAMVVGGVVRSGLRGELHDSAVMVQQALRRLRVASRLGAGGGDHLLVGLAGIKEGCRRFAVPVHPDGEPPIAALALAAAQALAAQGREFPADQRLSVLLASILTDAQALAPGHALAYTALLEECAQRWPDQVVFTKVLADHWRLRATLGGDPLARAQDRRQALAWAQRTVALYPVHLPFRAELARLAEATGDAALAARERGEIARLAGLVHPVNRLRPEDPGP